MIRKLTIFLFAIFLALSTYLYPQERQLEVVYQKKRIALVMGNAAYKSAPLRNPANDANDMAAALKRWGFDLTLITNANKKTMEMAIRDFGNKLKRGGIGLFYYAGHGMQIKGVNYLIPIGTSIQSEDEVKYESVDAGRVLSKMESAGNDMNIIILDACRDNPFARSFRSSSRGLARMDAPKGTLIVYATSPGNTAADGPGRNGIFTEHFLNVIKETNLEITHLLKEVRKNVIKETNGTQIPWESSSLIGNFYFSSQPKPAKPEVTIEPRYGSLEIYVDISGANVYQDGELVKETTKKGHAFIINKILVGSHIIKISHEECKDFETIVNIYEDKVIKIIEKLEPIKPSVQKKPTILDLPSINKVDLSPDFLKVEINNIKCETKHITIKRKKIALITKTINSEPFSNANHINYDMNKPYNIYCGFGNNGGWLGPHLRMKERSNTGEDKLFWIRFSKSIVYKIIPVPDDADIIYFVGKNNHLHSLDKNTHRAKIVTPISIDRKLRINTPPPCVIDPFNEFLFFGSQYIHRSRDKGHFWEISSPDLTTNNPERQEIATISCIAPSRFQRGVIWVGTNDGVITLTRDGGKTWKRISKYLPFDNKIVPKKKSISSIEVSKFDDQTAWVVVQSQLYEGNRSIVFFTQSFGEKWKKLNLDVIKSKINILVQDMWNNNLLFLGTDAGLFISSDGGTNWYNLSQIVPEIPINDIKIHPRDNTLLLATSGRGIIEIENIQQLRNLK